MKATLFLTTLAILAFLSSCTSSTHLTALVQAKAANQEGLLYGEAKTHYSYWSDNMAETPLRVTIDLSEQTAYFYRGEEKVGQSRIATGKRGHSTPTGSFTISEKVVAKRSTLYGQIYDAEGLLKIPDADTRQHTVPEGGAFVGCRMPYWMRLTDSGIGMHVGPIPNPGSPASHGCVRMPPEMARSLFNKAPAGTRVTIIQ
jgi:lipoprotein-anchoring transpeptidase ErfK/SrfK